MRKCIWKLYSRYVWSRSPSSLLTPDLEKSQRQQINWNAPLPWVKWNKSLGQSIDANIWDNRSAPWCNESDFNPFTWIKIVNYSFKPAFTVTEINGRVQFMELIFLGGRGSQFKKNKVTVLLDLWCPAKQKDSFCQFISPHMTVCHAGYCAWRGQVVQPSHQNKECSSVLSFLLVHSRLSSDGSNYHSNNKCSQDECHPVTIHIVNWQVALRSGKLCDSMSWMHMHRLCWSQEQTIKQQIHVFFFSLFPCSIMEELHNTVHAAQLCVIPCVICVFFLIDQYRACLSIITFFFCGCIRIILSPPQPSVSFICGLLDKATLCLFFF